MSICIVSMKRTRSSILSASIAEFYGSKNYFGMYDAVTPNLKTQIYFNKLPKNQLMDAKFDYFKQYIKNLTNTILSDKNSVVKLFPRYFIYHDRPSVEAHDKQVLPDNFDDLLMITDIEEYFQLSKFNKIYYLERNVTDTVCSYSYAIHLNKFHFFNQYELDYHKKHKSSICIDLNSKWLDFCIFEYMLLTHLKKYMDNKNIKYHILNFENIPAYCEQHYSGTKKNVLDSKFNYKNLIENYTQVEEYVKEFINKNTEYVNQNIIFV